MKNIDKNAMIEGMEKMAFRRRKNACAFAGFVLAFMLWLSAVFVVLSWGGIAGKALLGGHVAEMMENN